MHSRSRQQFCKINKIRSYLLNQFFIVVNFKFVSAFAVCFKYFICIKRFARFTCHSGVEGSEKAEAQELQSTHDTLDFFQAGFCSSITEFVQSAGKGIMIALEKKIVVLTTYFRLDAYIYEVGQVGTRGAIMRSLEVYKSENFVLLLKIK